MTDTTLYGKAVLKHSTCGVQVSKYCDNVILMSPSSMTSLDKVAIPTKQRDFLLRLHINRLKSGMKAEQHQAAAAQEAQEASCR
jgi:hypothetical protein